MIGSVQQGNLMTDIQAMFSDPHAVAKYTEGPPRFVPGYNSMLSMAAILLAERAREDARILALGAGGGLELRAFAQAQPRWTFDGVDPSAAMLDLARQTLGPLASRAHLHRGYVDATPEGPFDGATCLLTLHFVDAAERRRIASEIRRRLKPGAPFVIAHFSIPDRDDERPLWLSRYSAFLAASGVEPDKAAAARDAVTNHLEILTPAQDEAILRNAGFSEPTLFYAGFTFRGWVAYA
ncbi:MULTISPECIES: class I SAM-dependent methyltransferase [Bradyrhizobium]|uniref:Blr7975 protein n=1 Tax=Bradyrhizobium diazoefficiens (strain JCM 10833 / BCRC 13528 / IAM 13628 / NBRC 14792 / USDA 110) TaxID=224911 RepID=Q89C23_BRADU|nr:class I SAM-dependent methyltransferase [Bradyrhizobium diazoefficiens]MBP1061611.1 tRNA (cmo5U34)-methyltransferase [Bradyrhizobium japonicum]AND92843.1 methyltransferase [Bradyrhizobium diazoefficiens USDA 110]AWO94751.1 class I SAM-dependent methyltransferase [Bradyrhizobium diazoefficiens]PDT56565.1 class I SAM-dependent methyltransferase [Bradyrhizobium diazoefficiens]QBP26703.1 class I SAM-dependent methyltransferase [Bradyrhizobium diazoefficiens]